MAPANRIKWLASIVVGAIVLILALFGGKWGTTYAANDGVLTAPVIDHIQPSIVRVGSDYKTIIIFGTFFDQCAMWVRITSTGIDNSILPLQVLPNAISVVVGSEYFTSPSVYSIYVVHSTQCTVPPDPPTPFDPLWDEISNAVTLTVYESLWTYMPIMRK